MFNKTMKNLSAMTIMTAGFAKNPFLDEEYLKSRRAGSKGPINPNDHTNKNKGGWGPGKGSRAPLVKKNKRKAKQAARNK